MITQTAGPNGYNVPAIASWDGACWTLSIAEPFATPGAYIYAIAANQGRVYAAGGAISGTNFGPLLAEWDGDKWTSLETNAYPASMVFANGDLVIGGEFEALAGVPARNIARWNGKGWSSLGTGLDGRVETMVSDGTNVFVAGYFSTAGTKSSYHFAVWHDFPPGSAF
jgi:hypothetical protein